MAFHVSEFVQSWKLLSLTPFVCLSKSDLLTGNIFKALIPAFEFGHPRVFVSQLQLQIRLMQSHLAGMGWCSGE